MEPVPNYFELVIEQAWQHFYCDEAESYLQARSHIGLKRHTVKRHFRPDINRAFPVPQPTFVDVDPTVGVGELEGQGRVVGLQDACVVIQDGQWIVGVAQERTGREQGKIILVWPWLLAPIR